MSPDNVWRMEREGYAGNATWFEDHYTKVPQEIVDFLAGDGISLEGKRVADIGTGDGLIALGLFNLVRPAVLTGYDIQPTDVADLERWAKEHDVGELPAGLSFHPCTEDHIDAATGDFDVVYSWSAFEHVSQPLAVAREIRRLMAPGGLAMIQVYPFYLSEHGDHDWNRPGFEHLVTGTSNAEVYLNRITADELFDVFCAAGFQVTKVELIHTPFHLPAEISGVRFSDLAISGVKLTAVPV